MPKYLGIIGNPIEHSLSPLMHNAALRNQNLAYRYIPFKVEKDDLLVAVQGLKVLNFVGFNVTIPYKVVVIPFLDEITEEARLIGAVNTVLINSGRLVGHNTDGIGFVHSLQREVGITPEKRKVLIFGAGGAARAVAVQLGLEGAEQIIIINRTRERAVLLAQELTEKISGTIYQGFGLGTAELADRVREAEIIVNATPAGMLSSHLKKPPIREEWLRARQLVVDLVYNPLITPLLNLARKSGAQILTGEGMLLYQGAAAYQLWTGYQPPVEIMRQALMERL